MTRKRRKPPASPVVSLFPFLAVLICTMGVLIVMLVLAVQSSSENADQAKQEHQQQVAEQRDALQSQLDLQQFRVQQIAKVRPNVQQRLEDAKLGRSHLEDEIRKLQNQAEQLKSQFRQLQSDQQLATASSEEDSLQIKKLQSAIAARELDLIDARKQVAGKPNLYSIVPTRTASGTARRPIYVECNTNGIELQPSGIKIPLSSFTRPIMPGNPLDSALLTTREHWNRFDAGSSEGEPYPLIVVRPGGATAYAIARRAMSSWDDEFGYELVEAEKELDWGTPDKLLTENLTQAIQISMVRQQQRVDQRLAEWMGPRGTRRFATTNPSATNGAAGSTGTHSSNSSGTDSATRFASRPSESNTTDGSFRSTGQSGPQKGQFRLGSSSTTANNGGSFDTTPNDSLSRFAESRPQWRPDSNQANSSNSSGGNLETDADNPLRAFQMQQNAGATRASTKSSDQASGNSSVASNQQQTGGSGNTSAATPASLANVQPLANKRGDDWALPTRTPGATPYRRPIRVECRGDLYIVHPSDPALQPIQVAVESTESVDDSIDQLIHQVWKQIEGWGIAEAGGYWKPVLRLAPNETGTVRAEELARKLEGSGIEIERLWR